MTDTSQPKWIWSSFLDPTDDCGSFCAPRPHMNGGPPNNDAIKYIRSDIYETQAARIAELEAASDWQDIATIPDEMKNGGYIQLARVYELDGEIISISTFGNWNKGYGDGPDEMGMDDGWADHMWSDIIPARSMGNPDYQHKGRQPTHWQPLPTPPKTEEPQ